MSVLPVIPLSGNRGTLSMYSINLNKSIRAPTVAIQKPATFPMAWFRKNFGKKPIINVSFLPATTSLDTLRTYVYSDLVANTLKCHMAVTYLVAVAKTIEAELNEDWTSYGLNLGKSGEKINPLCSVELNDLNEFQPSNTSQIKLSAKDDIWIAMILCANHRLSRIPPGDYRNRLIERLEVLIQSLHTLKEAPRFDYQRMITNNLSWSEDLNFTSIVAAYDMFFFRFEHHPFAKIRFGSVSTRMRDCTALMALVQVSRMLGFQEPVQFLPWLWTEDLIREADSMFGNEEEYGYEYSYFYYHMDFGMCARSAYSCTSCPGIYFVSTMVIAMALVERGLRAKFNLELDIGGMTNNAFVIGYVLLPSANFRGGYIEDTEEAKAEHKKKVEAFKNLATRQPVGTPGVLDLINKKEPTGTKWSEWLAHLKMNGDRLTPKMEAHFSRWVNRLGAVREGSIGNYLKSVCIGFLPEITRPSPLPVVNLEPTFLNATAQ